MSTVSEAAALRRLKANNYTAATIRRFIAAGRTPSGKVNTARGAAALGRGGTDMGRAAAGQSLVRGGRSQK